VKIKAARDINAAFEAGWTGFEIAEQIPLLREQRCSVRFESLRYESCQRSKMETILTKENVITLLREKYLYLASEYGVKRIGLFGSYVKGTSVEASDVDLVVEFERSIGFRFVEFSEYLESLLGKKVDILTPAGVQGIRVPRVAKTIEESIEYV
jgi:predicted nucleotidyltransferase